MVAKHEAYLPWSKAGRPSELKWYCVTFLLDGCFISSILTCSFCKVRTVAVCDVAAAPSNNTKRRSFVHAHRGQCPLCLRLLLIFSWVGDDIPGSGKLSAAVTVQTLGFPLGGH